MRHRMLAPIVSIKHYVQQEKTGIASGAKFPVEIVQGVGQSAVTNTSDVVEGSVVKAVFLEFWVKSNASAGTDNKFQLVIEKLQFNAVPISFTQMNNLMSYPNKRNILFFSQGVIGDLTTQSVPIVRQWFKIPKGKQRFALGDELVLSVSATGAELELCGFSTYKEYK